MQCRLPRHSPPPSRLLTLHCLSCPVPISSSLLMFLFSGYRSALSLLLAQQQVAKNVGTSTCSVCNTQTHTSKLCCHHRSAASCLRLFSLLLLFSPLRLSSALVAVGVQQPVLSADQKKKLTTIALLLLTTKTKSISLLSCHRERKRERGSSYLPPSTKTSRHDRLFSAHQNTF